MLSIAERAVWKADANSMAVKSSQRLVKRTCCLPHSLILGLPCRREWGTEQTADVRWAAGGLGITADANQPEMGEYLALIMLAMPGSVHAFRYLGLPCVTRSPPYGAGA